MQNRRSFLAHLTGLASVGGVALATQSAGAGPLQSPPAASTSAPRQWDTAWIDALKGKHRQVYDLLWHVHRPNSLNPPGNYLDAHKEMSGLEPSDLNVVVVSTELPINSSDALWAKYKLGDRYKIMDPATGQPAVRNIYLGSATAPARGTVRALQARGVIFCQCNNSLRGLTDGYARELGKPASEVYAEFAADLNPGVKIVVSLTWLVGTLQERGFTYEKL